MRNRTPYVCLELPHESDFGEFSQTLCNASILGRTITRNPDEVTCWVCKQIMEQAREKAARLDPILSREEMTHENVDVH